MNYKENPMITSSVAFYPCASIAETDKFYKDLLGLDTVFSTEKVKIYSANKGHFGFVEYPEKEVATGKLCLSFNVQSNEEVDRAYHLLMTKGARIKDKPSVHSSQPVYSFFLRDPNGYLIEFQKIIGLDL